MKLRNDPISRNERLHPIPKIEDAFFSLLADKRLTLNAGWDNEIRDVELSELQGVDFDLSILGFDDSELGETASNRRRS